MLSLARSQSASPYGSWAARLPYGVGWAPGVHRLRSGAFCAVFEVEGFDTLTSTVDEIMRRVAANREFVDANGSDWWYEAHVLRRNYLEYREAPDVGNRTLWLLDQEQKELHTVRDRFFVNRTFIAVGRQARPVTGKVFERFVMGRAMKNALAEDDRDLEQFEDGVRVVQAGLRAAYRRVRRVGSEIAKDELGFPFVQDYIAGLADEMITGRQGPLAMQVDAPALQNGLIGGVDVVSGDFPEVNGYFHAVLTIDALPMWTMPGYAEYLNRLSIESRTFAKFEPVGKSSALGLLGRRRLGALGRAGKEEKDSNPAALSSARALSMAYGDAAENGIAYGYYSAGLVLRDRDLEKLTRIAQETEANLRELKSLSVRLERRVAFRQLIHSYLFSNGNATRPLFASSWNASHLFPLTSVWRGHDEHPSPKMREKYGSVRPTRVAIGRAGFPVSITPTFEDVGITGVIGPAGAGKTTAMKGLMVGDLQLPRALVVAIDSSYSTYILNRALGGIHIDLSGEHNKPMICPAARIRDGEQHRGRFVSYMEDSLELLANRQLTTDEVADLRRGTDKFASSSEGNLSLTQFRLTVASETLWPLIDELSRDRQGNGLLDAGRSLLPDRSQMDGRSQMITIEVGTLAGSQRRIVPILAAIFDWIESLVDGWPLNVYTDEAHKFFRDGRYAARFDRFARELRKANGRVIHASQYYRDYATGDLGELLGTATRNWFLLPNSQVMTEPYADLFLPTEQERLMVRDLTPKRDVLFKSPDGEIPFDFGFGPAELSLIGKESIGDIAAFREIENEMRAINRQSGIEPSDSRYRDYLVPRWFEYCNIPNATELGRRWCEGPPGWRSVANSRGMVEPGLRVQPVMEGTSV